MRKRISTSSVIAVAAAALMIGLNSGARAQQADAAMAGDTARVVDTVTAVAPADTMTERPNALPVVNTRFGTFYIGVGGGTSIPSGDIHNGYNPGLSLSLPMGWDSNRWPLGLRLDLSYDRLMARSTFRNNGQTTALVNASGGYSGTARIAGADVALSSAMLDAKARVPLLHSKSATAVYVLGGGGVHYFFNYAKSLALTNPAAEQAKFAQLHAALNSATSGVNYSAGGYSSVTRLGANAGAGVQRGVGKANLFVEGRYVTIFTKDRHTNYWPLLLGAAWR
jgi:hypothetical protein